MRASKVKKTRVTPYDIVTCNFESGKVTRSGSRIYATGAITGCIPHEPDTCSVVTEIQWYNTSDKTWETVSEGPRNYGPPCQGTKSSTSASCETKPLTYSYRSLTIVAIVNDGDHESDSTKSDTSRFNCL